MERLKWEKTVTSKELEEEEEVVKNCAGAFYLGRSVPNLIFTFLIDLIFPNV